MVMTGKCKHGEFNLLEGCPQCVAERRAGELKAKLEAKEQPKPNIIKVKYFSETTGELSVREYTYYSADPLKVGDIVMVPVRDTTGKAKVSAVDVSEAEIAAFKDKVKTIPLDSKVKPIVMPDEICDVHVSNPRFIDDIADKLKEIEETVGVPNRSVPNETEAVIRVDSGACLAPIALRPGEDIEVHSYFEEAMKLLEYAEKRALKTIEDARLATDDLSIISKLKKAMEAKRKEKLAPHEAQVKAIRDTYNYLMVPVLEAERITKEKQVAFIHEQERIQQVQEEINRKRMEAAREEMKLKGELTESVNLVEVNEAPAKVTTDFGSSGMVDHWVFEIVDFTQVPDEYKVIDSAMLNAIARKHHDAKKVPGVIFKNEPYLATRAK